MYSLIILKLVRNGTVTDWASLCLAFQTDPNGLGTIANMLLGSLDSLASIGFIQVEGWETPDDRWTKLPGTIRLGDAWLKVQHVLGLSLEMLLKAASRSAMIVEPFFGPPSSSDRPDVFVIMPFGEAHDRSCG
jgi:hypothetical protein